MMNRYMGSSALLAVSLCGMLFCEGPNAADLRKMVDQQVAGEKEKIETHFAEKRSKLLRQAIGFESVAALCTLAGLDSVIKTVKGEFTGIDSARTVIAGVPACLCSLTGLNLLWKLRALNAEKQAMIDQVEDQAREFKREITKQERAERVEAARIAAEQAKQPTNTPVTSDAESDEEDNSSAADSDTKS